MNTVPSQQDLTQLFHTVQSLAISVQTFHVDLELIKTLDWHSAYPPRCERSQNFT